MLRSNKNSEKIQDIRQYGIDITKQLESILVDELAKSIDAQIMMDLLKALPTRIDRIKKVKNKIKQMREKEYNNYE